MSVALPKSFQTKLIHAGSEPDAGSGAIVQPITLSTTFKQEFGVARYRGNFVYSRADNPNRDNFELALAAVEGAQFSLAFPSGSATVACVAQLVKAGEEIVCTDFCYSGSQNHLTELRAHGIVVTFVDTSDPDAVKRALNPNVRLLWLESPTNPLLSVTDIAAVCAAAHAVNKQIVVCVDNTMASPFCQRPLTLGASIVSHSVTKYLNGHDDVTMGAVATNDLALHLKLRRIRQSFGCIPSPFDCYLAQRGMKTLVVRVRQQCESALQIAKFFEKHADVARVSYPGLSITRQQRSNRSTRLIKTLLSIKSSLCV